MNTEPTFIIKQPQFKDSQNYRLLRSTGLKHIEQLSKKIWTDYNIHDPGITILEVLCYAITDLGYRTGFDIKDLLTTEARAELKDQFQTAAQIFPCAPVTFNDLRKILIDIDGVYNAWITKNEDFKYCIDNKAQLLKEDCDETKISDELAKPLNGLYNVLIQFEDFVEKRFLGLSVPKSADLLAENFIETTDGLQNRGLKFEVKTPLHIKSVTIIAEKNGTATIRLVDNGNNVLKTFSDIELSKRKPITIALDWRIKTLGIYQIDIDSTVKFYHSPDSNLPIQIENLIEITENIEGNNDYHFFYNWEVADISEETTPLNINNLTEDIVLKEVKNRLYKHRNLCEDFVNIEQLKTEQIAICADIEVSPNADLEEVLSEIYYQLEIFVSPPVQFYTIQELFDKGKTSDEIFEGPMLERGFIDDDEFRAIERRDCLRSSDIIQIIMDVEGVTAVKSLSLLSFINKEDLDSGQTDEVSPDQPFKFKEEEWELELESLNSFAPDFVSDKSKIFFYKNDLPYLANKGVTEQLLAEKRARQIQKKLSKHQTDLTVSNGNYRNLSDYYPMQNDLPETYFVGNNPVPRSRPKARHAQSKQLKTYLLFFEQLLANYLAQLSNLPTLFAINKGGSDATYFTQKIQEIESIEQLYKPVYKNADNSKSALDEKLEELIETPAIRDERKNKFLDHLIARFCETFTEYSLLMYSFKHLEKGEISDRLILDKQAFLTNYSDLSSQRGKGFNYREPTEPSNLTGFQKRVYGLLGIYDNNCKPIRQNFSNPAIVIMKDVETDPKTKKEITYFYFQIKDADNTTTFLFNSAKCTSRAQVCIQIDTFLAFGSFRENWLFLSPSNPASDTKAAAWVLKRNCVTNEELITLAQEKPDDAIDEILGYTVNIPDDETKLTKFINKHFKAYADREGFHVVEHILLRPRAKGDSFLPIELNKGEDCDCVQVKDPYSFRASIILPSWPTRFRSIRFRQFVEKTLRLEAPAHVYLRICWINHCEMREFETYHDAWLQKHSLLDCEYRGEIPLPEIASVTDADMKEQLEEHQTALNALIAKLFDLTNIFAVAKIHGCDDIDSDEPQISLNNTSLGSL